LTTTSSQRGLRWGALLLLAALPAMAAHARPHHSGSHHSESWARDRFAAAERMGEALNGRPPADRSRRDYQRVIDAYRNVYYGAPSSTKADPSVVAVAETLVEMGRRFDDDKILNHAIAQYKFLRREYPGSKYRCDALFTIGEIYNDDLNDPEQARATFKEFLHRYPHNRLVEDAQKAIADLDRQAGSDNRTETEAKADKQPDASKASQGSSLNQDDQARAEARLDPTPDATTRSSGQLSGRLPRVTGIRHWSTPDYTRVAIDLESEVKFGSSRIARPDRIFFDLRDTKLASTLVGKSFDVDDGFLKKIRVAQFKPGRTRVVLEVDDLSDYDAFLLPDPYRLIIDIHGKGDAPSLPIKDRARDAPAQTAKHAESDAATSSDGAKAVAPTTAKADAKVSEPNKTQSRLEALRAQAGKAPVTREDVGDDTKITPKSVVVGSKEHPSAGEKKLAIAKGEVAAPTKVVVEADDEDPTPVPAARLEAPAKR
jgi:N-acetylmuramoyl-L-alanine amidase